MHVVFFSSSIKLRGWICHPPPLLPFGVVLGIHASSHGVIYDLHPGGTMKSRQRKAGLLQDTLINGNCCLVMGLSIHSPKCYLTTLHLHQDKGGALLKPEPSFSQNLPCRCPQGHQMCSRTCAIAGRAWGNWSSA